MDFRFEVQGKIYLIQFMQKLLFLKVRRRIFYTVEAWNLGNF